MVTLRQLERHAGLNELTQAAAAECVKSIVGVQFRNLATVGGSVYGRFGFSDVLTFFMAVNAQVELYHRGLVSVEEFAQLPDERDILVRVIVPRRPQQVAYLSRRNTRTDFPVLACCIAQSGEGVRCCIGARPGRAVCLTDEKDILSGGVTPETAKAFGDYVSQTVKTGDNLRASGEYRRRIAGVLARRALIQLAER
jgi:CO/xanthine dehydrogenase FAD-binding subunit